MSSTAKIQHSILTAHAALSLSELLTLNPSISRRTAQRSLSELINNHTIVAIGGGRSRKYLAASHYGSTATELTATKPTLSVSDNIRVHISDQFPAYIPQSADSKDILNYIEQPLSARSPVGYQRSLLDDYEPNVSFYLSEPMRRQLYRMGNTGLALQPAGTYGRDILSRLLIDLSWASSHLEGNTYSRLDTVELIEHGKAALGKASIETQMILNHKAAIELLVDNPESIGFNRYTILNLHSILSENLLPNPFDEGRIRQHRVDIGKSVYRPISGDAVIAELLDLLLAKAQMITDPFEQSFFMMVHLPYLQPFADVNKRTSRLAANLPLIRANLCPLTFLDVPEEAYSRATLGVYEMNRIELLRDLYVWAYERSTREYIALKQQLVEPDPMRLEYRNLIKRTVYQVITSPDSDPEDEIRAVLTLELADAELEYLTALIIEELRRLHEGVLARYGIRPSQLKIWKDKQKFIEK
ncbi:Fic family protein [Shewanella abyssi]|uniref:Fic family protein n=1 Tax=Shewanella abyssi TaxID=311789 RepID=UPI00200BB0A9|nr:Fic family protein [Shewanella abyssi]MCL1049548.1 Fic family protein [Shewanella abyssi]